MTEYRQWVRPHVFRSFELIIPRWIAVLPRMLARISYAGYSMVTDAPPNCEDAFQTMFPRSLRSLSEEACRTLDTYPE
jgi:hypothetical protein